MSTPTPIDLQQIADLLRSQEAKIEQLARRIPAQPAPILPRPEAIAHVRCASGSAFDRWCARWRVRPCSHGRYARRTLDSALHRESLHSVKRSPRPALAAA